MIYWMRLWEFKTESNVSHSPILLLCMLQTINRLGWTGPRLPVPTLPSSLAQSELRGMVKLAGEFMIKCHSGVSKPLCGGKPVGKTNSHMRKATELLIWLNSCKGNTYKALWTSKTSMMSLQSLWRPLNTFEGPWTTSNNFKVLQTMYFVQGNLTCLYFDDAIKVIEQYLNSSGHSEVAPWCAPSSTCFL